MTVSFASKRIDDLMDELSELKRDIRADSDIVSMADLWKGAQVDEEVFEEAEKSVFREKA